MAKHLAPELPLSFEAPVSAEGIFDSVQPLPPSTDRLGIRNRAESDIDSGQALPPAEMDRHDAVNNLMSRQERFRQLGNWAAHRATEETVTAENDASPRPDFDAQLQGPRESWVRGIARSVRRAMTPWKRLARHANDPVQTPIPEAHMEQMLQEQVQPVAELAQTPAAPDQHWTFESRAPRVEDASPGAVTDTHEAEDDVFTASDREFLKDSRIAAEDIDIVKRRIDALRAQRGSEPISPLATIVDTTDQTAPTNGTGMVENPSSPSPQLQHRVPDVEKFGGFSRDSLRHGTTFDAFGTDIKPRR